MKISEWVKIGEVVKSSPWYRLGIYARYAVMEYIKTNGDRKYKETLICTWTESISIESQKQSVDPS